MCIQGRMIISVLHLPKPHLGVAASFEEPCSQKSVFHMREAGWTATSEEECNHASVVWLTSKNALWDVRSSKQLRFKPIMHCSLEAQKPTQNPEIPKNDAFTRTFSKSSRELLPSSLWHESGTQWKLFRKTCSDEPFYFGWIFFRVDFPPLTLDCLSLLSWWCAPLCA